MRASGVISVEVGAILSEKETIIEDTDLFGEPLVPKSPAPQVDRPIKQDKSDEQIRLDEERRKRCIDR